jgi:hypothetical protein
MELLVLSRCKDTVVGGSEPHLLRGMLQFHAEEPDRPSFIYNVGNFEELDGALDKGKPDLSNSQR